MNTIQFLASAEISWWEKLMANQTGFALGVLITLLAIWKFVSPKIMRLVDALELMARSMSAFLLGSTNHTEAAKKEAEEIQRRLNETKK